MAINENFVFTDPVAAQQVVQMADIDRARAEAQGRALAATTQALSQGRGSQTDRQLQLYQLMQQQQEAEKNRQARAQELGQSIASQEKIAGMQLKGYQSRDDARQAELRNKQYYDALLTEIESEDPPTDSEFMSRATQLPEHLIGILKNRLTSVRNTLNNRYDLADNVAKNWQSRIDAIPPDKKTGKRPPLSVRNVVDEARKSKEGAFISFDEATQTFRPILRRPRVDILPGSGVLRVNGGTGGAPAVTPIEEVRNRMAQQAGMGTRLPPWIGNMNQVPTQAPQAGDMRQWGLPPWIGAMPQPGVPPLPPEQPAYVPPQFYDLLGSPIPQY